MGFVRKYNKQTSHFNYNNEEILAKLIILKLYFIKQVIKSVKETLDKSHNYRTLKFSKFYEFGGWHARQVFQIGKNLGNWQPHPFRGFTSLRVAV